MRRCKFFCFFTNADFITCWHICEVLQALEDWVEAPFMDSRPHTDRLKCRGLGAACINEKAKDYNSNQILVPLLFYMLIIVWNNGLKSFWKEIKRKKQKREKEHNRFNVVWAFDGLASQWKVLDNYIFYCNKRIRHGDPLKSI